MGRIARPDSTLADMSQTPPIAAELLLQHEAFVRAVARGLLGNDDRVHDVVQETWMRALRNPPRRTTMLRAWLGRVARNLALDTRRSSARSRQREVDVARSETTESVARTHERLSAQREVVDAVLALDEPYASVVLLRYYDELSTQEIGQRLGRSAATVRSQLSRAHEQLRGRLDSEFEGGRSAWAGLLLAAPASNPKVASTMSAPSVVALATVGVAVAGLGAFALMGGFGTQSTRSTEALGAYQPPQTPPNTTSTPLLAAGAVPASASERRSVEQEDVPVPTDVQLTDASLSDLLRYAVLTQRAIGDLLLTPDPAMVASASGLLALPNTGIARVLNGSVSDNLLTMRGGGAYFSFTTEQHSYDAAPDLSFRGGAFRSAFAGHDFGILLELGDVGLESLVPGERRPPTWLTPEAVERWNLIWADYTLEDAAHGSDFRTIERALPQSFKPQEVGTSYLLRSFKPHETDHVVAFRVETLDDHGCTLTWRVLETRAIPGEWRGSYAPSRHPALDEVVPAWLTAMDLAGLEDYIASLRTIAGERLFEVPAALQERYLAILGPDNASFAPSTGFARILQRGEWDALAPETDFGAYYSFVRRSNSWDDEPEIGLEQDRLWSGLSGRNIGLIIDLGIVPFAELSAVMGGAAPAHIGEATREALAFLHLVQLAPRDPETGRTVSPEDQERIEALELDRGVAALVGHTYALRSAVSGSHDHLVVFTLIGEDESGFSLAWRIVQTWPAPK